VWADVEGPQAWIDGAVLRRRARWRSPSLRTNGSFVGQRVGVVGVFGILSALAGCDAASPDPAYDALLQVAGAQWRPGPPPAAGGGPEVVGVNAQSPTILRDSTGQRLSGALAPGATALWIGLDGDAGGWITVAGLPSVDSPDLPSIAADVALAADAPLGPVTLRLIAIDGDERAGEATTVQLVADDVAPPAGELVFALAWDGAADLDLHVIAPDGGEAWSGDPNTWDPPPPGTPPDPNAWRTGGLLDRDANAGCRRDPRPREHVIWSMPPPAGRYVVRVDTRSLCGAPSAYYVAAVYRAGATEPVAAAAGVATPDHEALPHGADQGLTVLELDLAP